MYCLGILDSGNYAFHLCGIFEKRGLVFEVVSVPCKIAKGGCGYCLKFPEEYIESVIKEGKKNETPLREIYKAIPISSKVKYIKMLNL